MCCRTRRPPDLTSDQPASVNSLKKDPWMEVFIKPNVVNPLTKWGKWACHKIIIIIIKNVYVEHLQNKKAKLFPRNVSGAPERGGKHSTAAKPVRSSVSAGFKFNPEDRITLKNQLNPKLNNIKHILSCYMWCYLCYLSSFGDIGWTTHTKTISMDKQHYRCSGKNKTYFWFKAELSL